MTNPKLTTRILLADDHQIVREGLRALLERRKDLEVIGETADGIETVKFAKEYAPEIVVMDVTMPHLNGIEATRQITNEVEGVRIVALSMYFDRHFVAKMLRAGARGYLRKDCASEELILAIDVVTKDKFYISPHLGIDSSKEVLTDSEIPNFIAHSLLTPKEREVLQLVAEGHATKEIAYRLGVSTKTIEHHRQHVMDKLDIHTIAELTRFAIREGLTSTD
ncbi:MAG TPA: response regulator transcription factor [Bacteroidota bacterium]|jgi:DNA-binding NarL/FixJ family response regulator|nr:response regulator transcription factor [Bacteroidota bacterium]